MTTLVVLPLDDRPVNYDYPRLLGAIANIDVLLPPREWLGNPWRQANHEALLPWLREHAATADGLVVAIDTLAYGGLIPSRTTSAPFTSVLPRLNTLADLKAQRPECPIYAFSVIQRVSRDNSSEEEQPYWAEYGSRMFRLSYLEHKAELSEASHIELAEAYSLRHSIPADFYADYAAIRARNHAVNQHMLTMVQDGVVDYLLLPQDDTAEFGWNIAEARRLQASIRRNGLTERAISYPGADEIGCLLLARFVCTQTACFPTVYPRFSSSGSATLLTAYEDRPMLELLKAHLAPLGGSIAPQADTADIQLFINAPALQQGIGEYQWLAQFPKEELLQRLPAAVHQHIDDIFMNADFQATRREMQTPRRSPEEFCRAINAAVRRNTIVAIADVAFVNGSDLILGQQLLQQPACSQLAAYGGWNTAGNTLGTVLAQAAILLVAQRQGMTKTQQRMQLEFLALRFLDDYCYQAVERSACMFEDLPNLHLTPSEARLEDGAIASAIEKKVAERLLRQATLLEKSFQAGGKLCGLRITNVHLPWQRLFEVGFTVEVDI